MKLNIYQTCIYLVVILFFTHPAFALINNSDTLYVGNGESINLANNVYKNISITVKNGGTINVVPYDGGTNLGKLNLVAPKVLIEGTINANGCGHDTRGQGGTPTGNDGGGGGGYGGKGGEGGGGHTGVGGNSYDTSFAEDPGSYGYKAGTGSTYSGYGGGAIRIDAASMTIGATAVLKADGSAGTAVREGGGSGGCILLNGIHTYFVSTYYLYARGGKGAPYSNPYFSSGGGGGGGGRIKIFEYNTINYGGNIMDVSGGAKGGLGSSNGETGTIYKYTSPSAPGTPSLMAPTDGQVVGTFPTFTFVATDPGKSKFLQYYMEFSYNADFLPASVTFTVDQRTPDAGWGGKAYFASDETASYTIISELATNTIYYWRVKVTNNEGASWSALSSYRTLTTTASNFKPTIPQLILPLNGQSLVNKLPALQSVCSDPEGDTLTFSLTLSTDSQLQNSQTFQAAYPGWNQPDYLPAGKYAGVTSTCQIMNTGINLDALIPGTDYYWRVTALDSFQQSTQSLIYSFSTVPLPAMPALAGPLNASVVTTNQPYLSIAAQSPTGGSLAYKIELSSDGFQTVLLFNSQNGGGWTKTTYASGETARLLIPAAYPLLPGTLYEWRSYAYDMDNDNWSVVTPYYSFTVITPPRAPELIFPDANYSAPNAAIPFRFKIGSESGNTLNGCFELSATNFQDTLAVFDQTLNPAGWSAGAYAAGTEMQFTLPASVTLERGRTYWWRVRGTDGISWGPYSDSRPFNLTNTLEFQRVVTVPNPAVSTSDLQIQLQLTADADITLRFFNKLGKQIDQIQKQASGGATGNVIHYDISRYASGIYFYVLEAKSEFGTKTTTKKFAVVK
jgi:hypothetical protein